jgi:SAM-dependent methyltransferase
VLDVGSGLCVFLHLMKQRGWRCTALDPDPRAARHAREVVGVDAIAADFMQAPASGRFDLVCFNKVLEHVSDPAAMLARARHWLLPGGLVYVELPDGEAAAPDGPGREEFFIDHHHVFSPDSLAHLARRAGLGLLTWTRLREASGKYTLRAFLAPEASHA